MTNIQKFNIYNTYKRSFRIAFFDKLLSQNTYALPSVVKASLFIDLKSLEDFDSSRVIAAMFILRLLGGRRPYVVRFGLFQTFHDKVYDAYVQVNLAGDALYNFLGLITYDIIPFLAKVDFLFNYTSSDEGIVANFTIADLSFLRVVETHSVFFR